MFQLVGAERNRFSCEVFVCRSSRPSLAIKFSNYQEIFFPFAGPVNAIAPTRCQVVRKPLLVSPFLACRWIKNGGDGMKRGQWSRVLILARTCKMTC